MTNAALLAMFRRRLRDVDPTAPLYADSVLWEYASDRLVIMQSRRVTGASGLSITTTGIGAGVAGGTIEDALGVLLVTQAAALLLRDLYTDKVQRGEFGVTWKSGLESESTVDARKAFDDAIVALEREAKELTLIRASQTSGIRVQ